MIKFDNYTMTPPPTYTGTSTETKPLDAENGSSFIEIDTGKNYIQYNGSWYEINTGRGTLDHEQLENRDVADQHPMSSITGLDNALETIDSTTTNLSNRVDSTESEVSNLSNRVDSIEGSVSDMADEIAVINGKVDDFNAKVPTSASSTNKLIATSELNSTKNELDTKIDALNDFMITQSEYQALKARL